VISISFYDVAEADLGLGLLSPAFVYILLSQISIPMTEKVRGFHGIIGGGL
jgi:hypothetical protein